jgi:hypothetical protein
MREYRVATLRVFAVASLLVAGLEPSSATVVIDTFDITPQQVLMFPGYPSNVLGVSGVAPEAIGGFRELIANRDGIAHVDVSTNSPFNPGELAFHTGADTAGVGFAVWSGVGGAGLGGVDLTEGGLNRGVYITARAIKFAWSTTVQNSTLTFVVINDFNYRSNITIAIPLEATGPTEYFLPFSSFKPIGLIGGADYTNVNEIFMNMTGVGGTGVAVDSITVGPVPEPGAIVLAGIGLLWIAVRRRRATALAVSILRTRAGSDSSSAPNAGPRA